MADLKDKELKRKEEQGMNASSQPSASPQTIGLDSQKPPMAKEITDSTTLMQRLQDQGNRPEDWLYFAQHLQHNVKFADEAIKRFHISNFYSKALKCLNPEEHKHNLDYALLLINCAKFKSIHNVEEGQDLFNHARMVAGRFAIVHIAAAQFHLTNGNPAKAKRILEKGQKEQSKPTELITEAFNNLVQGSRQLLSEESLKKSQIAGLSSDKENDVRAVPANETPEKSATKGTAGILQSDHKPSRHVFREMGTNLASKPPLRKLSPVEGSRSGAGLLGTEPSKCYTDFIGASGGVDQPRTYASEDPMEAGSRRHRATSGEPPRHGMAEDLTDGHTSDDANTLPLTAMKPTPKDKPGMRSYHSTPEVKKPDVFGFWHRKLRIRGKAQRVKRPSLSEPADDDLGVEPLPNTDTGDLRQGLVRASAGDSEPRLSSKPDDNGMDLGHAVTNNDIRAGARSSALPVEELSNQTGTANNHAESCPLPAELANENNASIRSSLELTNEKDYFDKTAEEQKPVPVWASQLASRQTIANFTTQPANTDHHSCDPGTDRQGNQPPRIPQVTSQASIQRVAQPQLSLQAVEPVAQPQLSLQAVESVAQPQLSLQAVESVAQPQVTLQAVESVAQPQLSHPAVQPVSQPQLTHPAVQLVAQPQLSHLESVAQPQMTHPAVQSVAQPQMTHPAVPPVAQPQMTHPAVPPVAQPQMTHPAVPPVAQPQMSYYATPGHAAQVLAPPVTPGHAAQVMAPQMTPGYVATSTVPYTPVSQPHGMPMTPVASQIQPCQGTQGFMQQQGNQLMVIKGVTYTVLNMLGQGGSSKVYSTLNTKGELCAIKVVNLDGADEPTINGYKNEIKLLKRLQYSHRVIKLYDFDYERQRNLLLVVMERGETDLASFIRQSMKQGGISALMRKFYWQEMLQCVQVLHKEGIVHSDLKPANFLLVAAQVKLIDFGIANAIQQDKTSVTRDQQIGTLNYMSPEAILDTCSGGEMDASGNMKIKLGTKSDVWSLGCILYYLCYGRTPFHHVPNNLMKLQVITSDKYAIQFPNLDDPDLLDTLKRCLVRNPKARASIEELLLHPYLQKI